MILKSVEIRGFKSFADYTELIFNQGVTAIVGPNGSGKSNISDAIRWCLGEQSIKTLRGGKMEDVIFAGTEFRKAVSLAQVSLTIDNSKKELPIEYSLVKVSRKLYRSGESEYSINNKVCKLKDIHELFFDTGIGKDGYSIIGQGKIDAILSGKADERRAVIEEAVGITKYKFKKEEAQNKINRANENLVRINDILSTYKEYLEPLYIEQNKAKEFLKFSQELKEIETLLISSKLHKISSEINSLNKDLEGYKDEYSKVYNERDSLKQTKDKLENDLEILLKEEKDKKDEYYKIKDQTQELTNNLNLENNNINILTNSIEMYKKQMDENLFKIENISSKENIINKTKSGLEEELKELDCYLNEFEKKFEGKSKEVDTLNAKLNNIKVYEFEILERNTTIKNKIEFIKSRNESLNTELSMFLEDQNILKKKIADIKNDIDNGELNREVNYKDLNTKTLALKDLEEKLSSKYKELDGLKEELDTVNKSIIVQKTSLNVLEQVESSYEGFNRASKTLMGLIDSGELYKFKNKCIIAANIFNTNKEYELAIETAIGGHISDIIVEDDKIAREIIEYLKKNNIGRITFHPLSMVKEFLLKPVDLTPYKDGFLDFAINLIEVEDRYLNVAKNILGNTLVCDNIDNGVKLAKKINFNHKLVTIDSQVINTGGSITGGSSYSKNVNILGRKRKIDEYKLIINRDSSKVKGLEEKILSTQKECETLKQSVKEMEDNIQNLKIKLMNIDNELNFKNESLLRESNEIERKSEVLKNLEDTILKNENDSKEMECELKGNIQKHNTLKIEIEEINNKINEFRYSIKEEEDNLTSDKIRRAKLEENISNIFQELERISIEKREIILVNQNLKNDFVTCENKIQEHQKKALELKEKIEELKNKNIETEKSFDKYVIEQNTLKNKIKELTTYLDDANQNAYRIENNINSLNVKLAKYETEFEALNEKLFNEYNLKLSEIDEDKRVLTESKASSLNQRIKVLKEKITALGNVNVGAIEEYKELNQKVEFMSRQKEDLDNSKKELEEFIKEVVCEMKSIFNKNFKIINEEFDKTFKQLFKGGSASLLLGEGDELESAIDIIVQPPGKRLQNINLLSGGEKGLSAIALLFSILTIRPVAFCVLDEIEAALDDNNVFRFSEFLKKFSSSIQFIVITHRKTTMESSDIIYGVTMQEKGVSKLVSINLADYKI